MKAIEKIRNVKAKIPLMVEANKKTDFAIKHPPNVKPKNKRAK